MGVWFPLATEEQGQPHMGPGLEDPLPCKATPQAATCCEAHRCLEPQGECQKEGKADRRGSRGHRGPGALSLLLGPAPCPQRVQAAWGGQRAAAWTPQPLELTGAWNAEF